MVWNEWGMMKIVPLVIWKALVFKVTCDSRLKCAVKSDQKNYDIQSSWNIKCIMIQEDMKIIFYSKKQNSCYEWTYELFIAISKFSI